jgi:hypothetical protein
MGIAIGASRRRPRHYHGGVQKEREAEETSALPPSMPRVPTRFKRGELNAFLNTDSRPTREDDTPVLMGANGRRATREELLALYEELMARPQPNG